MTIESPSYTLVATLLTPEIDPGDKVEVSIHIVGYGQVEKANLEAVFNHPHIFMETDCGRFIVAVTESSYRGHLYSPWYGVLKTYPIDTPAGARLGVWSLLWERQLANKLLRVQDINPDLFPDMNSKEVPEHTYPDVLSGLSHSLVERPKDAETEFPDDRSKIDDPYNPHPPIILQLETKSLPPLKDRILGNSPRSGDYDIEFVLTYGDSNRVVQNHKNVSVHVNSFVERNSTILRIVIVLLAFITALPLLIGGFAGILDFVGAHIETFIDYFSHLLFFVC